MTAPDTPAGGPPAQDLPPASIWAVPGMVSLAVVAFAGFAGYAALLPVAPLWAVHGGADSAGAGLVNFVLLGATVATQFAVPALIRRTGWTVTLTLALVLLGVPAVLHVLTDELGPVLVLSAVRGVGFGILTVAGSAASVLLVDPSRRGAAVGSYSLALALPNVLLMPVGGWVAEAWGFWVVFTLSGIAVLGIPATVVLGRHLPERATSDARHPDVPDAPTARAATFRAVLPPSLVLLGITLSGGAFITFAPQMVSVAWLGTGGLFAFGLVSTLLRWRAGAVADRMGPGRVAWVFVLVAVIGLLVIAWLARDAVGAGAVVLWMLGSALLGAAYGALQTLTMVRAFEAAGPRHVGAASAIWNAGFDTGTALGSVLVGAVAVGSGFGVGMALTAGIMMLTLPLALRARR